MKFEVYEQPEFTAYPFIRPVEFHLRDTLSRKGRGDDAGKTLLWEEA
jgi:hypothetical protein